jgi:hypothetical protein
MGGAKNPVKCLAIEAALVRNAGWSEIVRPAKVDADFLWMETG